MDRRKFLNTTWQAAALALYSGTLLGEPTPAGSAKILGMYVHEHWPYRHPYSARTWTVEDWRGYADGLQRLGYNTLMIWPMVEIIPDPPTPSDRAALQKHHDVIRMVKNAFGMRVILALCPNVIPDDVEARSATFEQRHFFYCDERVNPADNAAVQRMMTRKRKLLEPLKEADGVAIIDSDPAGYPGSNNAQFVALLGQYRKMLDELRRGIELNYWMHAGWEAYCRYYETAVFKMGTEPEFDDTLRRLEKLDPEPWGIATAQVAIAERAGLASRVLALNYGRIEPEPSFPLTIFGGDHAYQGGRTGAARGVMGNAQTHCVQLPNTFAFARGAQSKPISRDDYLNFASRLIPGQEEEIVHAWEALAGTDSAAMRTASEAIRQDSAGDLQTGELRGLLFGSPNRFMHDLVLQLHFKAAALDFFAASEANRNVFGAFGAFLDAADAWQHQHGYENRWRWPELQAATAKLHSERIDEAWNPAVEGTGLTKLRRQYALTETMTPRLLEAMRDTWSRMNTESR